jgi:hypothetical protein
MVCNSTVESATIFSLAGRCFIRYSNFNASLLVILGLRATNATGSLERVYFAPRPFLWAARRVSRFLAIPQYNDPSAHRSKYTVHSLVPIAIPDAFRL